jgi:glutamate dehydrogenase
MPDKAHKIIIQKLTSFTKKKVAKIQPAFLAFLEQYYAHAPLDDLHARSLHDLYSAAASHWKLMQHRKPGEYKRRVFNPALKADGWESSHTILQFILDDQPFLVDTLCTEINRKGLTVHFIVHLGGIKVLRNARHEVTNLLPFNSVPKDSLIEAPICIEIDKQTNPTVLKELEQDLDRVISDARAAANDWQKMKAQVYCALEDLEKYAPPLSAVLIEENKAFLHWLLDNHFTLLGFRSYDRVGKGEKAGLRLNTDSGLGVLQDTSQSKVLRYFSGLPKQAQELTLSPEPLLLAKTNTRSTVHGARYTDFISVKRFNQSGEIIGERWFIGLYTSAVYSDDPKNFPIVRQKISEVLKRSGLPQNGHAYKALTHILKTLPRDDLFHATTDELFDLSMGVLQLQDRRCIRLFARKDIFNRFISCLVYVPRDDFNMELCYRMEAILKASFNALEISYTTAFSDSVLARIHFTVRINPKQSLSYDLKAIEQQLIEVGTSWKEGLHKHLIKTLGEEKGSELSIYYERAFPAAYRENFSPQTAVQDILHLENLHSTHDLEMSIYQPLNSAPDVMRFKLYHLESTVPLSDAIPVLEKMGLRVIGEQPYCVITKDGGTRWINDFNMCHAKGAALKLEEISTIFQDAFRAIWHYQAEHDGFNSLVLAAQLPWREVALLRSYAKYLKQIGITFSQDYIEQAICNNPAIATLLVHLFLEQFTPARKNNKTTHQSTRQQLIDAIKHALSDVANLDEDRILRMFLNLIRATVRTNYFQTVATTGNPTTTQNQAKSYISLKFNPSKIRDLPLPRPMHEIFVYAPHFEGVHLRADNVSRGGIRWSDRREDFRREVLGLMKAQQVKNAVIVPAGAKGGFVAKLIPQDADRDAIQKEGIRCYQDFIRGLLDITDNLQGNKVVPPKDTVCRDGNDPYLVVAADKGTASFSDIANQISKDYGYWLYDAFASGGSTGYDHKKIAITARGAWESVKRHFQESNMDINKPFTVIGIGDMAGDVFGNGMLLSDQIKLIAAFNGTHIFLDPNPDPAISFKERQRLFNLPRSTWEDYNPKLMTTGGGVFKRNLKSIKLSNEVKKVLATSATALTPNELIQAILKAPVDLLWNGGIGTFVKAKQESHLDAGDRSSDHIRIDGHDLRCRVVGEGGNLGFTQLGRIEYALNGGRLNTDFIDNSGGVDCSDHEVNIKILLNERVLKKQMTEKQRNLLLAKMQDDVAKLVLHNNYRQARVVSLAVSQSFAYLNLYERYLKDMAKQGKIDRKLEFLPNDEVFAARRMAQKGLTSPEIAVLLAYSKIILKADIIKSDLSDDPYLNRYVAHAFPPLLSKPPFGKTLPQHRLYREIMATQLSNLLITDMGITFVYQMQDETGASMAYIARAYVIMLEMFHLQELWEIIESLEVSAALQTTLTLEIVRLMRRSVRWLLRNQRAGLPIQATMDLFSAGIKQLDNTDLLSMLSHTEKAHIEETAAEWIRAGVPAHVAMRIASMRAMYSLLNIIKLSHEIRGNIPQLAQLYFKLSDCLELDTCREKINDFPSDSHWMLLARSAAKGDLDFQQRTLSLAVYQFNKKRKLPLNSIDGWLTENHLAVERWKTIFADLKASHSLEYSMLVVVMRELAEFAQAASQP